MIWIIKKIGESNKRTIYDTACQRSVITSDNVKLLDLISAVKADRSDLIMLLASHGANVSLKTDHGDTLLHVAVYCRSTTALRELLKHGLPSDVRNDKGVTPIWYAADMGDVFMMSDLKDNGADINFVKNDSMKYTFLHLAALKGFEEITQFLLDNGMSVDVRNANEKTPLHVAATNGQANVVSMLIGNKAMVNARSDIGSTPLHYASLNGHLQVVRYLIEGNATVDFQNKYGSTPLHDAAHGGHVEIIMKLLENGYRTERKAKWSPLHVAASRGHLEAVIKLIEAGYDINEKAAKSTALSFAVMKQSVSVTKELLKRGASVVSQDIGGMTPLHIATQMGNIEIMELLLQHNADVNAEDTYGRTPLHWATISKNPKVTSVLLDYPALLNTRDTDDETPLGWAFDIGNKNAIDILTKRGGEL